MTNGIIKNKMITEITSKKEYNNNNIYKTKKKNFLFTFQTLKTTKSFLTATPTSLYIYHV